MLATGVMANDDEANSVMDELIALRYTGSQLRFAFLMLLEQEAAPNTLYNTYSHAMMKDFLDSGLAPATAEKKLIQCLHAHWIKNGNLEEHWKLAKPLLSAMTTKKMDLTAFDATSVLARMHKDKDQRDTLNHILQCIAGGQQHFVFVGARWK